jgi:hypothetical protein
LAFAGIDASLAAIPKKPEGEDLRPQMIECYAPIIVRDERRKIFSLREAI